MATGADHLEPTQIPQRLMCTRYCPIDGIGNAFSLSRQLRWIAGSAVAFAAWLMAVVLLACTGFLSPILGRAVNSQFVTLDAAAASASKAT